MPGQAEADDGYFPRGSSILRRVHEEKAVGLLYGQRALCIGAVKPLNYVGTSIHSRNRSTPFRRLIHTGLMFEAVFFGDRAQADRVLGTVARMHESVVGVLPQDAGPHYPAGTPYSAVDPELMLWTVAVLADSAQWFYERLVHPLSDLQREALWQDYLRFGELFGMPREAAPATHAAFAAWYEQQLAGEDLHLTEEARYMGRVSALEIPMPAAHRPAKWIHDAVMLGSLPMRVRELYGLRWTARDAALCAFGLRTWSAMRRGLPSSLTRGSCARELGLVASTERRRIERGLPTPQLEG
jgi:uncharacterized protein (DUF2236 family)